MSVTFQQAMGKRPKRNKYGAKVTIVDGIRFPSKAEADRWCVLKLRQRAGEIRELTRQPKFELFGRTSKVGTYTPDFQYLEDEALVVEEVKGHAARDYPLRRSLFKDNYPHIDFREIKP